MMFNRGGEERDTMSSQMGYMTAKVEELDRFVREHMREEESRFAAINRTIALQRRYLVGLTVLIISESAGFPIRDLLALILKVI